MPKMLLIFLCFIFIFTGCSRQEETEQTPSTAPSTVSTSPPMTSAPLTTSPAVSSTATAATSAASSTVPPASSITTVASSASPPAASSAAPSEAALISETLTANNELLAKYIKASGNGLISMVGLGELMKEVKAEAETASGYTAECLAHAEQLTDSESLSGYCEKFSSVQLNLSSLNDKMKEAKRNQDINEIESALSLILSELQGYSNLLKQFLEER